MLGGSKAPVTLDVQPGGDGLQRISSSVTTKQFDASEESTKESGFSMSLLGLSIGTKKSSSSSSSSSSSETMAVQEVSVRSEAVVVTEAAETIEHCDKTVDACVEAYPADLLSDSFRKMVEALPVTKEMREETTKILKQMKEAATGSSSSVPTQSILSAMPPGVRQPFYEFIVKLGKDVRNHAVLGVQANVRSTAMLDDSSSASSSSSQSSISASFKAFTPGELGEKDNKITTSTVTTTEDGKGGFHKQEEETVMQPASPAPEDGDEEEGGGVASELLSGAAGAAANALVPGSGAIVSEMAGPVADKLVAVAEALAKVEVQMERASFSGQASESGSSSSNTITTIDASGGNPFAISISGDQILGTQEQSAGAGDGMDLLSSSTRPIADYAAYVSDCTPENSKEMADAMPKVTAFTPSTQSQGSKEEQERDTVLGTLGMIGASASGGTAKSSAELLSAATATYSGLPAAASASQGEPSVISADARSGLSFHGAAAQAAFGQSYSVQSFPSIGLAGVVMSMVASQKNGKGAAALGLDGDAAGLLVTRGVIAEDGSCDDPTADVTCLSAASDKAPLDALAETQTAKVMAKASHPALQRFLEAVVQIG